MKPFDPRLTIIAAQAKVKTGHVFHCWHSMKDMGAAFHVEAFATFAGLETRHVDEILAALTDHKAMPKHVVATVQRGARLAADWTPPSDWIDWAREERFWTVDDATQEAMLFGDYWHSVSGQKAVKTDWLATWRNWVRRSRRPNGQNSPTAQTWTEERRVEHLRNTIEIYERMGRNLEAADLRRSLERIMSSNVILLNRTG
jgi:hypothetical protein